MSKGLQPSGRLVTAIVMERLQFERERSVPWMFTASDGKEYEQPPVEPINFGKMCERIAEIKYVGGPFLRDWIARGWEVPEGWGKYSMREYEESGKTGEPMSEFVGPHGYRGPLYKSMKKEAADQLKVLMKRDDCPFTVKGVAEGLIPQHDDVLMIKESCENWTPDRPLY